MWVSSDDPASFGASYWSAMAVGSEIKTELSTNDTADTVIIGAGYTGLSAALRLMELGRDTIVIEANEPGFGASGRNAGCWVPNWGLATLPSLRSRFGDAIALSMAQFMVDGGRFLPDLISHHQIECDLQKTGVMYVSNKRKTLHLLRETAAGWQMVGGDVSFVEATQLRGYTGSARWLGGLLYRQAGLLNPLSLSRGLAATAQRSGIRLYVRSPVVAIEQEGNKWRVSTNGGSALVSNVLIATNAFRPALLRLSSYFISLCVGMVTSEPIPDWRRYLPSGSPYGDMDSPTGFYVGFDQHNCLTASVLPRGRGKDPALMASAYWRQFRKVYPWAPATVRWDYAWKGHICIPQDKLAKPLQLAPNLYTAFGYAGSGIVHAIMLGREMADWMATGDRGRLRMPEVTPKQIPFANHFSALLNRVVLPVVATLRS